jgi:Tfp pilus assembly protein PilO
MQALLSRIHIFIILYFGAQLYLGLEEHEVKVRNIKSKIPRVVKKIKRAEKEVNELKKYYKDIDEVKVQIETIAQEIEKIQRQLPGSISDAENLDIIKKIAESLNIKEIYLTPKQEQEKGFYYSKKYNLKGKGTYLQFLIFFEKIGEVERIMNISRMDFTASKKAQRGRYKVLDADIVIESFRHNPNYREDRGVKKIEKEASKKV